ncbi:MAG: glycosyltransferase [Patescibacteria group bacterium]|jgi:glycosyltransferase involved in cell wall biosynthesis
MPIYPVTVHTVVKNEDRFIWYTLKSVLPYVERALVFDTGSTDKTAQIVKILANEHPNLEFSEFPVKTPNEYGELREKQVQMTNTLWFLVLDGDEIWPEKELLKLLELTKTLPEKTIGVVNRTINCVGDIWHYLPESFGKYELLGRMGHLNIRLLRNQDYTVTRIYPGESYLLNGQPLTSSDNLVFSDAWYLHATHLRRSSERTDNGLFSKRRRTIAKGITMPKKDIPEVLLGPIPKYVEKVSEKRGIGFEVAGTVADSLRLLRNKLK